MSIRALARRHVALFGLLLLITLATRLLVPAGYMPALSGGMPTLTLCGGTTSMPEMQMRGGHSDHGTSKPVAPSHAEIPCAFASLGLGAAPVVDPILLAIALAFVLALAIRRTVAFSPRTSSRLRPPLRAPPSSA